MPGDHLAIDDVVGQRFVLDVANVDKHDDLLEPVSLCVELSQLGEVDLRCIAHHAEVCDSEVRTFRGDLADERLLIRQPYPLGEAVAHERDVE